MSLAEHAEIARDAGQRYFTDADAIAARHLGGRWRCGRVGGRDHPAVGPLWQRGVLRDDHVRHRVLFLSATAGKTSDHEDEHMGARVSRLLVIFTAFFAG